MKYLVIETLHHHCWY